MFHLLKHGIQKFDRSRVSVDATLLIMAAIVISVPSMFNELIAQNRADDRRLHQCHAPGVDGDEGDDQLG